MATNRCQSTYRKRSGETVRCEHLQGHDSVHFNDNVWWPNKHGLPQHQREHQSWLERLWKAIRR